MYAGGWHRLTTGNSAKLEQVKHWEIKMPYDPHQASFGAFHWFKPVNGNRLGRPQRPPRTWTHILEAPCSQGLLIFLAVGAFQVPISALIPLVALYYRLCSCHSFQLPLVFIIHSAAILGVTAYDCTESLIL